MPNLARIAIPRIWCRSASAAGTAPAGDCGCQAARHERAHHARHRKARCEEGRRDRARHGLGGLQGGLSVFRPGFAPGTGSPEPGGLLPREALQMIHTIAAEGLCGMEVVEVSPPYDVNDNTAQLAARVILDVLGTLVAHGHLGHRNKVMK